MMTPLCFWLWFNCSGALWAHLSDGGKKPVGLLGWSAVVLSPIACTAVVVAWTLDRAKVRC